MSQARTMATAARERAEAFVQSLNDAAKEGVHCDFEIQLELPARTFVLKRFVAFEPMKLDN